MLTATMALHISFKDVLFHFKLFQSKVILIMEKNPRTVSRLQQKNDMHLKDFRIDSLCCEHSPYPRDLRAKIQSDEYIYEKCCFCVCPTAQQI